MTDKYLIIFVFRTDIVENSPETRQIPTIFLQKLVQSQEQTSGPPRVSLNGDFTPTPNPLFSFAPPFFLPNNPLFVSTEGPVPPVPVNVFTPIALLQWFWLTLIRLGLEGARLGIGYPVVGLNKTQDNSACNWTVRYGWKNLRLITILTLHLNQKKNPFLSCKITLKHCCIQIIVLKIVFIFDFLSRI